jgi:hypothetical protein
MSKLLSFLARILKPSPKTEEIQIADLSELGDKARVVVCTGDGQFEITILQQAYRNKDGNIPDNFPRISIRGGGFFPETTEIQAVGQVKDRDGNPVKEIFEFTEKVNEMIGN